MARHVLLLSDVFESILDQIAPHLLVDLSGEQKVQIHEVLSEHRKAFYALAQTCRATSEPSLDRLWRTLDSIVPLIQCFSKEAYDGNSAKHAQDDVNVVDTTSLSRSLSWESATRPPTPAEWATIHRYSIRVRELCVQNSYVPLKRLFLSEGTPPPQLLFPNLRVLIWNNYMAPITPRLIQIFLTPTLVSFHLCRAVSLRSPRQIVDLVLQICPNLKAFTWAVEHKPESEPGYVEEGIQDEVDAFYHLHLHHQKLENFQLIFPPSDPTTLKHIITFRNVKVLSVGLQYIDTAPTYTPFPNVEVLRLFTPDLRFITSLLRPEQQMFRDVVFGAADALDTQRNPLDSQSLLACFHALATPQRSKSFESFHVKFFNTVYYLDDENAGVLESDPARYCITHKTLFPLTSFSSIRLLSIEVNNQISLDDGELESLVCCWPSIETLHLFSRVGKWPLVTFPTLRGLLALLSACPRLRQFSLFIDARNVPLDANPDVRSELVHTAKFINSPIGASRPVIDFFRKHLPGLKWMHSTVYSCGRDEAANECLRKCGKIWQEVKKECV